MSRTGENSKPSTKYQVRPSERLQMQSHLTMEKRWPDEAPHLTHHAIGKYGQRLPTDAVEPPLAWLRGEDIEHPVVVETENPMTPTPSRVRVYNHDDQYVVAFLVSESTVKREAAVVTVYSAETHGHAPTRAYLRAHGPHFEEDETA